MSTSFYNKEVKYYQNSIISMGSISSIVSNFGYLYDNSDSSNLFPVCDILVEVVTPQASPHKKIKLYKISGFSLSSGYNNIQYYQNVLLYDDLQPYFIDCNSKQENFPISLSYSLNEDARYQYYVFSKIFLSPCEHIFYFKYDSGIDFNAYLLPYTLSM